MDLSYVPDANPDKPEPRNPYYENTKVKKV